jgi:hypothetical protein
MASSRPKGYITLVDRRTSDPNEWKPTDEAIQRIAQVRSIINAANYRVSVRFIFYRLVGNFGYPKTEKDYKNLAELLVKARRARLIDFRDIADSDPALAPGATGWRNRAHFLNYRKSVNGYTLDPGLDQPFEIELWSEDAGSVPMLAEITRGLPITIYSTGGFSSVTVTHEIAERVMEREVPTIFLHIGDYDPSGESIFKSMSQDVGAFISDELGCDWDDETGETYNAEDNDGPDFRPIRVALTREQADMWQLETAPPKASDSRSRNWVGETVQVQAMTEEQMREVVERAIYEYLDMEKIEELRDRSEEERDEMAPLVSAAMDNVIAELGE